MLCSCGKHPIDSGISRIGRDIVTHEDSDADSALLCLPVGDGFSNGRIVWIDWFDQAESVAVLCLYFEDVAGVVAVHREWRHQDRAVDSDRIHCRDHLI